MSTLGFMKRVVVDDRITRRQQEFLDFIQKYQRDNGEAPTFREIALGLDISSKGTISVMIDRLERMGLITREGKLVRGIKVR